MIGRILSVLTVTVGLLTPVSVYGQSHGILALAASAVLGANPAGTPPKAKITYDNGGQKKFTYPSDDEIEQKFMKGLLLEKVSAESIVELEKMYPLAQGPNSTGKTFIYDYCSQFPGYMNVYDKEFSAMKRWDGFGKETENGHLVRIEDLTALVLRLSGGAHIQVEMRLAEANGKLEITRFAHVLDEQGKTKTSVEIGTTSGRVCEVLPALLRELRKNQIEALEKQHELDARKKNLESLDKLNQK